MSSTPQHNLNRFAHATWLCLTSCAYNGAEAQNDTENAAADARAAMVRNELAEEQTEFQSEARLDLERMDAKLQRLVSETGRESPTAALKVHSQLARQRRALEQELVTAGATSLAEWDRLERRLERRIRDLERSIDAALGQTSGTRSKTAPLQPPGPTR